MIAATQHRAPLNYVRTQEENDWVQDRLASVAQRVFAQDLRYFPDELSDGEVLSVVREMESGAWLRPYAPYTVKRQMELLKGSCQNPDVGDKMWAEAFGDQEQEARLRALAQLNTAMRANKVQSTYSYALAMHPRLLLTHWCQQPQLRETTLAALAKLPEPYQAPKVFLEGDQDGRYLSQLERASLARWLAASPAHLQRFPELKTDVLFSYIQTKNDAKLSEAMQSLRLDPDVDWLSLYAAALKQWPGSAQRSELMEWAASDRKGFVQLVVEHLRTCGKIERLPRGELEILRSMDPSPAEWGATSAKVQERLLKGELPPDGGRGVEDGLVAGNSCSSCCESCTIL